MATGLTIEISEQDVELLVPTGSLDAGRVAKELEHVWRLYGRGAARNTGKNVVSSDEPYRVQITLEADMPGYLLRKTIDETKQDGKTKKTIVTELTETVSETTYRIHGGFTTDARTGAAGALAAKYLAPRQDAIAIIGSGNVARQFALAAQELFGPQEIRFASRSPASRQAFTEFLESNTGAAVRGYDLYDPAQRRALLENVPVLFEAAPLNEPLQLEEIVLMDECRHVSSMTGDGLQHNFAPEILLASAVVVDDEESARKNGELRFAPNAPVAGTVGKASLGELDELNREPSFYDSTGMGVSDLAAARLVVKVFTAFH